MKFSANSALTEYKKPCRGAFGVLFSRALALLIIAVLVFANAGLACAGEASAEPVLAGPAAEVSAAEPVLAGPGADDEETAAEPVLAGPGADDEEAAAKPVLAGPAAEDTAGLEADTQDDTAGRDVTVHFGEDEEREIRIHVNSAANPQDEQNPGEGEKESEESEILAEAETETETEYVRDSYVYEDDQVKVTAAPQYPGAIPSDAVLRVTEVTPDSDGYNYDAYMDALNSGSEEGESYDSTNTVLLDIAFIMTDEDGREYEFQPEDGTVDINIEFKNNKLSDDLNAQSGDDVSWTHLPVSEEAKKGADTTAEVTDITAKDIKVEPVSSDTSLADTDSADFVLDHFSVVAGVVKNSGNAITVKVAFTDLDGNAVACPEISVDGKTLYAYLGERAEWGGMDGKNSVIAPLVKSSDNTAYEVTLNGLRKKDWQADGRVYPFDEGQTYLVDLFLYDKDVLHGFGEPGSYYQRVDSYSALHEAELIGGRYVLSLPSENALAPGDSYQAVLIDTSKAGDAGTDHYKSILGKAVNYGIVCDDFTLGGDAETNIAVINAHYKAAQTGNDLTNPTAQSLIFASVENGFKIKGDNAYVRVPEEYADHLVPLGSTVLTIDTSYNEQQLTQEVSAMRTWAQGQSAALASRAANACIVYNPTTQKYEVDLTNKGAGCFYVNMDDSLLSASHNPLMDGQLNIKKGDNQTVVFNILTTNPVVIQKYSINNVDAASYTNPDGNRRATNHQDKKWSIPQTVVWNIPNTESVILSGSATGIFLASNATVEVQATGSGWVISKAVEIQGGEWHNVYQFVEEVEGTAVLNALKTISGSPSVVSGFTFTLEQMYQNGLWHTVSTAQNENSAVTFDKLCFNADNFKPEYWIESGKVHDDEPYGVYLYRITESQGAADSSGRMYNPDPRTYYARIIVSKRNVTTSWGEGNNTGNKVIYSVSSPEYFEEYSEEEGCTKPLSFLPTFNNTPKGEPTELTVEKLWEDENGNSLGEAEIENLSATFVLYRSTSADQEPVPVQEREDYQVTLNKADGWSYTWENLPSVSEGGQDYIYYVKEKETGSFTVRYGKSAAFGLNHYGIPDASAKKVTATNFKKVSYTLPATGGAGTHRIYLVSILLIAFAGAGLILIRRRREIKRY